MNFIKIFLTIIKKYKYYAPIIILYEFIYLLFYTNKNNNFYYLNDKISSDSIPSPYYYLLVIKKFLKQKKIKKICDLGCGAGKTLFFFGKVNNFYIKGYELNKEIYKISKKLTNKKIKVYNENILYLDYKKKKNECFLINDPIKNKKIFLKLIQKLKNNNGIFIFINLKNKKRQIVYKNFKLLKSCNYSFEKNILFCKKK